MTDAPSAPSARNTPSRISSVASGISARRGASQSASTAPTRTPTTTGSLSILTREAPHRPEHAREPLRAFEFAREFGRLMQRVQGIAGDQRIEADPNRRREQGKGEVAHARAPVNRVGRAAWPRAPQPVGAAEHPRVRTQQAGRREQQEHHRTATRTLDLERKRPHDERKVGDVEIALDRQVLIEEAREHQQRGEPSDDQLRSSPCRRGTYRPPARRTTQANRRS